ncbi:hypothetical protein ERJ75_001138100 [Trypanosoma vivax]|nr:hypothetical protein ERJ75_001138100 [Trypanosoma vivax]
MRECGDTGHGLRGKRGGGRHARDAGSAGKRGTATKTKSRERERNTERDASTGDSAADCAPARSGAQKALAAKLAENVRQRTALTAAAIDSWIKTFAGNFKARARRASSRRAAGETEKRSIKVQRRGRTRRRMRRQSGRGERRNAAQQKMPDKDNEWEQAVNAAKGSESDMLVGTATDTKCTLTASTAGNYAGAAGTPHSRGGFFWQLTGSGTASSVELKWSDAHQDAGTDEQKSEDALNEMWLHFKQLKETHRQIINGVQRSSKRRASGGTRTAGTLRRRKKTHAPRHSEKGHGGRRQQRGAQGTARRSHRARSADTGKRKHAKGRSTGGTATQQNKQGGHRGPAPQTRTAASESAAQDSSCRQQARGAAATLVAFLRVQEPPARGRLRNGTNQRPTQQEMSTRLSAKQSARHAKVDKATPCTRATRNEPQQKRAWQGKRKRSVAASRLRARACRLLLDGALSTWLASSARGDRRYVHARYTLILVYFLDFLDFSDFSDFFDTSARQKVAGKKDT